MFDNLVVAITFILLSQFVFLANFHLSSQKNLSLVLQQRHFFQA